MLLTDTACLPELSLVAQPGARRASASQTAQRRCSVWKPISTQHTGLPAGHPRSFMPSLSCPDNEQPPEQVSPTLPCPPQSPRSLSLVLTRPQHGERPHLCIRGARSRGLALLMAPAGSGIIQTTQPGRTNRQLEPPAWEVLATPSSGTRTTDS